MNDYTSQPIELDLKDLLCVILKKWGRLLIAGVVCAILLSSYEYVSAIKKSARAENVVSVLDTTVMLPGETDEEYSNRVKTVDNAHDIMNNIAALTDLASIQNNYINCSIYMDLDPLNVATSRAQVLLTLDSDALFGHREALGNAYTNDLLSGNYLDEVSSNLGYDEYFVRELIWVDALIDADGENFVDYGTTDSVALLILSVCGPSVEFTDAVLDGMLAEINAKTSELNSTVVRHSVVVAGRQSYVAFSESVRDKQVQAVNTLNTLYTQINSENVILDNLAKQLGLTDRNDFYELNNSEASSSPASVTTKDLLKYGMIGFLLGLIVLAAYYTIIYIFGRKIVTKSQFCFLFIDVKVIGVSKPLDNRSTFVLLLDQISGDDNKLSIDNTNKIIGANFKNLTSGMSKILITGTADEESAKKAINDIGLNGDFRINVFEDPSALRDAASYDGIVLIEQRGLSEKRIVSDELRLLKNSGTKIVGAIIL